MSSAHLLLAASLCARWALFSALILATRASRSRSERKSDSLEGSAGGAGLDADSVGLDAAVAASGAAPAAGGGSDSAIKASSPSQRASIRDLDPGPSDGESRSRASDVDDDGPPRNVRYSSPLPPSLPNPAAPRTSRAPGTCTTCRWIAGFVSRMVPRLGSPLAAFRSSLIRILDDEAAAGGGLDARRSWRRRDAIAEASPRLGAAAGAAAPSLSLLPESLSIWR